MRVLNLLRSRPRLFMAFAAVPILYLVMPAEVSRSTRLLLAWNSALIFYLSAIGAMMLRSDAETVSRRAAEQDVGQHLILALSVFAALLSFGAIAVEVRAIRHADVVGQSLRVGLILLTILLSWCFVQTIFALRYAHLYHRGPDGRGLAFPGRQREPDYLDFLYFAFTIGAAFATSDVDVTEPDMRRVVLLHTVISFLFNSLILGLSVNIGASLL